MEASSGFTNATHIAVYTVINTLCKYACVYIYAVYIWKSTWIYPLSETVFFDLYLSHGLRSSCKAIMEFCQRFPKALVRQGSGIDDINWQTTTPRSYISYKVHSAYICLFLRLQTAFVHPNCPFPWWLQHMKCFKLTMPGNGSTILLSPNSSWKMRQQHVWRSRTLPERQPQLKWRCLAA